MNKTHFINHKIIILFYCVLVCALWSAYLGLDISWDIANYHYYNAYAFLNHRDTIDYWPVSFIQAYFNPTADLFSYLLIHLFSPYAVTFINGGLHGLALWLTYLIIHYFMEQTLPLRYQFPLAIVLTFLSICSAPILSSIGNLQNDNLASIFVLAYIYLQLKALTPYPTSHALNNKLLIVGSFLLGIAIGIKLTSATYFIGAFAALLIIPLSFLQRLKSIFILFSFTFCGMIVSSGNWMWFLWKKYHNPFFPFLNGWFHSPFFQQTNFHFQSFIPATLKEALLFPLHFSLYGTSLDNMQFTDVRFAIVYVLFIIYGGMYLWHKIRRTPTTPLILSQQWLFFFVIFSFICWEYYFSIVRYLTPLTFLCPLLIYLLISNLIKNMISRIAILFFLYSIMIISLSPISPLIRSPHYHQTYFNITMPTIVTPQPALVLVAYPAFALSNTPKPQTYLIPFFPPNWRFAGIPFKDERHPSLSALDIAQLKIRIRQFKGDFYLLSSESNMPSLYETALTIGLKKNGSCADIKSNRQEISGSITLLCPVARD